MKYYIYALCNTKNDKRYIGQTSNPSTRFYPNQYRGMKISNAIKEIGWDNFYPVLLAHTTSKKKADRLERKFIDQYDSVSNGYNSTYCTTYIGNKRRAAISRRRQSRTMHTIRWFYNPATLETMRILPDANPPEGWLPGRGGCIKKVSGHDFN